MKVNVVRIGNSRGIRLPKAIIDQCRFGESVELAVRGETLHVRAAKDVREGWSDAFAAMADNEDDGLIDGEQRPTAWDRSEWRW
jgi:antitoxin MazE